MLSLERGTLGTWLVGEAGAVLGDRDGLALHPAFTNPFHAYDHAEGQAEAAGVQS